MNKVILSAAIVGLTLASERSKIEDTINKVGEYVVNHQDQIETALKMGAGAARLIEKIVGHKKHEKIFKPVEDVPTEDVVEDEELFSIKEAAQKVGGAAKAVGGFVVRHQDQIEKGINTGIAVGRVIATIVADEVEDEELFSVKDAAKKVGGAAKAVGGFVAKHQGQIEGAINTGINVAKFVADVAAGDEVEDEELFTVTDAVKTVGGAVEKTGQFVVEHHGQIQKGISAGITVAKIIGYIAADEVEDEELFSIKDAAKKVGGAAKAVGGFVVKHQDQIEKGINTGIAVGRVIATIVADEVEDEELFSVKDAAKKVGGAVKAAGGFVAKHQGQIEGAINTGINVAKFIGEIAAEEVEPVEKEFLGF